MILAADLWLEGAPKPWDDWKRHRECRDLEPLLAYNKLFEHQSESDRRIRYLMPPEDARTHEWWPADVAFGEAIAAEHPYASDPAYLTELRQEFFDDALREWKKTGTVPFHDADRKSGW